jgi:hypothetical protein
MIKRWGRRTCWSSVSTVPSLASELDGADDQSTSQPAFTSGKKTSCPLYRRLDRLLGLSRGIRKISLSPGFELRTVHKPVARNYTGRHILYVVKMEFCSRMRCAGHVDEVGKDFENLYGNITKE